MHSNSMVNCISYTLATPSNQLIDKIETKIPIVYKTLIIHIWLSSCAVMNLGGIDGKKCLIFDLSGG